MKRRSLILLLLVFSCAFSLSAKDWFEGGTLHQSLVSEWRTASYSNKLATCADWLTVTLWKGKLHSMRDFDRIKDKSQLLLESIEIAIEDNPIVDNSKTAEVALIIISSSSNLGSD